MAGCVRKTDGSKVEGMTRRELDRRGMCEHAERRRKLHRELWNLGQIALGVSQRWGFFQDRFFFEFKGQMDRDSAYVVHEAISQPLAQAKPYDLPQGIS